MVDLLHLHDDMLLFPCRYAVYVVQNPLPAGAFRQDFPVKESDVPDLLALGRGKDVEESQQDPFVGCFAEELFESEVGHQIHESLFSYPSDFFIHR